ncbi:MAG: ABC transporter, partial [Aquihabitans sp.]
DEPTAGVDRANQEALAVALGALVDQGTTIVLITHELGPVEPLITRAVILRDGLVVHDGPPLQDEHHHHHDDDWHHTHGDEPVRRPDLGLMG